MEFGMFHEFQALPGETAAESFANSLAPVSYTHLTLPTILHV